MIFLLIAFMSVVGHSPLQPVRESSLPEKELAIGGCAMADSRQTAFSSALLTAAPADSVDASALISFAQTLKGIRYKYASADPKNGFDCSGFVLYVFRHFHINVPRSSAAFSKIGKKVSLDEARPGDIILFTGTQATGKTVGHVGIVTAGGKQLSFIHATSGKKYSVTETTMTPHYLKRFVKVVRVL